MRIAYFDCFSGASGDMILGALLDAGCPEAELRAGIERLAIQDALLDIRKVKKQGFAATQVDVRTTEPPGHRHLHHITKIISEAKLPPAVADRAIRIFTRLAQAEAAAHGSTIEKIHFHEVGAADAIIDIVGASIAVDLLGVQRIVCSPIPTGHGTVRCEHGVMPIPAPGTAALLKDVPLAACDEPGELTTPTGAAILTTLADSYGSMPAMTLRGVGYGAGRRDGQSQPNLLRLVLGDSTTEPQSADTDYVISLEANIDDATGESLGYAMERLLAAGALDVFMSPAQMKKNRPGVHLTVLAMQEDADRLESMIFAETTTFGVRRFACRRRKLSRTSKTVQTPFGAISVKVGMLGGKVVVASPEYEDCARAARQHSAALRDVMDAARRAFDA